MAIFSWVCNDCLLVWDKEYSPGKAPNRRRCPECNKLSERYYGNQNLGFAFDTDTDFHTVRSRERKFREKGYDKTAAERWYRRHIADAKERLADERGRYIPIELDRDWETVSVSKANPKF